MTANQRIFLNIVATYGRSLYALALGLFTARWALQALGAVDYGLMGVVAGMTGFISFLNNLVATAVGRFYAIAVGKASVGGYEDEGLEECRKWFSTAVFLHTFIPCVLMVVGYPLGIWSIENFLTIPADRITECIWAFRFVCVTCFVSMVTVPVNAMYEAKQYIAELTVYSFITTTVNALLLYYMVTHPGVWLAKYVFWTCAISLVPAAIISIRGFWLFKECRLVVGFMLSWSRCKQLMYFVGCWMLGCGGDLLRSQGVQILLNMYFGPQANASMTIANNVNAQTKTLSSAMVGAFQPAIVSACGAGDYTRMRALSFRACKLSVLFILLFSLPLGLELQEVLELWLVNPPEYVYGLCLVTFAITLIDQSTTGHMVAVNANGKIALYHILSGGVLLLTLPIAWAFCAFGWSVYSVAWAMLLTMVLCAMGRVWFARKLVGMSSRYWLTRIIIPIVLTIVVCAVVGSIPILFMTRSFWRVCVTTAVCEVLFVPFGWCFLLDTSEKDYVKEKLCNVPFIKPFLSRARKV